MQAQETNESPMLLGELLVDKNLVRQDDVDKALQLQESVGGRLGSNLIRVGAVSEDVLIDVLSEQLDMPVANPSDMPDPPDVYRFMHSCSENFEWFLSQGVILWEGGEDEIICIARDVMDLHVDETLRYFHSDQKISYQLSHKQTLELYLNFLEKEHSVDDLIGFNEDTKHLRELAEEAPIIELVNNILAQAIDANASDIHIEPLENVFNVRLRVDGVLHNRMTQPSERYAAVASRVKLISGLDIAERRLPQDGRITTRISGREMDVRVSTAPCINGESIVLRLLPKERDELSLNNLGMEADHLTLMNEWMRLGDGIVLVTGPTGSGKSTTLYSSLDATNDGVKKIITVEDPVEFQLSGITQIQAHAEIGYTFSRALRAILRQDPDVIMIGEIRDLETAEIAIQSALTGHLVLSTLHTNDAVSAFTRLIDMGVEPFLVAAPVKGVQAQRLVRKICPECSESTDVPAEILKKLENVPESLIQNKWVKSNGCNKCQGTGYKGRMGIYQLVPVDNVMQDLIVGGATLNEMKNLAVKQGCRDLYQDGLIKASKGLTTIEEVLRVAGGENA